MQQYVNHDPSPKASDFSCSFLTYDGHKGTDFGLRDPALLDRGVFVVAAAAGRVVARRDGVIDKIYTAEDAERVDKIECGNGVVIQHDNGVANPVLPHETRIGHRHQRPDCGAR